MLCYWCYGDQEELKIEVEKEAVDLLAIVTSPFITGLLIQFLYPVVLILRIVIVYLLNSQLITARWN
jgi:hypothetical protein